jgi:hypothetical protein
MDGELERLIESLLWEGYALYPYTPGATKNATPTPFGIAYPPAYASGSASTYDHLELRSELIAAPDAVIDAEVRFLAPSGERHTASERRLAIPSVTLSELARGLGEGTQEDVRQVIAGASDADPLRVRLTLTAVQRDAERFELCFRIENLTASAAVCDRASALTRSLISTHPIVRVRGGRFVSPLESTCASSNTFPVLASPGEDAVIGAAIVLPDHPQIAPESRGGLFDSTEIEEALLLHLQVLSDSERDEIGMQDPAVREMLARASATTPQEMLALHGRVTVSDPPTKAAATPPAERPRLTLTPPSEPAGLVDPTLGQPAAEVDGVCFRRGGKVRIHPPGNADLQARVLEGRTGRIERILTDYDGKVHFGLTVEGDPGQELMSESGRLLYFFAPELEVLQ